MRALATAVLFIASATAIVHAQQQQPAQQEQISVNVQELQNLTVRSAMFDECKVQRDTANDNAAVAGAQVKILQQELRRVTAERDRLAEAAKPKAKAKSKGTDE